jgi:ADP-heptose:LPS heptosyltransferase
VPEDEALFLGEECPAEFFRIVIEALADSFSPADVAAYEQLMRVWIPETPRATPVIPDRVDVVYVLSRVTLGSDIKITSGILDTLKNRFPDARIVLAGSRKSAELFAADPRIGHLEANYPRSGPVSARLEFAPELRRRLEGANRIVVDPDSRMTQLGLMPACEPEHYFHFPSRTADTGSAEDLTRIAHRWLRQQFGLHSTCWTYIAPQPVEASGEAPRAAVSLGVGANQAKRVHGDFEARLIRSLGEQYKTVWVDRGAGGEEAARVTAAVEASGVSDRVRFWEGSFAGFASIVARCDLYVGYDSAGQHAAAASQTPLITIFAGAPSLRFRQRWAPFGEGRQVLIAADNLTADAVHEEVLRALPRSSR